MCFSKKKIRSGGGEIIQGLQCQAKNWVLSCGQWNVLGGLGHACDRGVSMSKRMDKLGQSYLENYIS